MRFNIPLNKNIKYLILLIFILSIKSVYADVIITEVMSNPIDDENLNEWVEIYNNDSIPVDIKGWIIADDDSQDTIEGGLYKGEGTIIPPYGFAIITDDATRVYNNFNVNNEAIKLYVDDASIGNGLSNSGEIITIYNNESNQIHQINYEETDDGNSWTYSNESWYEAIPTPGYTDDDALLKGCDWKVEILLNNTIFSEEEPEWKIYISKIKGEGSSNLTLFREVTDAYGNIIVSYDPLDVSDVLNHRTYSYSPNLEAGNSYIINTSINSSCEDTNLDNNYNEKIIFIASEPKREESSINVVNIYDLGTDEKAKWGQVIRARIDIYKGDTNKDTIKAWVEKNENRVTKITSVNIYSQYSTSNITIPIQLDSNCEEKYEDGDYKLVVEGLNAKDSYNLKVGGLMKNICEVQEKIKTIKNNTEEEINLESLNKPYIESNSSITQTKNTYNISNKLTGDVIYTSSDTKTKKLNIYIFTGLVILLLIYFILKR